MATWGGGTKSIETQLAIGLNSGQTQASEADNPGAEERGGLLVWKIAGDA